MLKHIIKSTAQIVPNTHVFICVFHAKLLMPTCQKKLTWCISFAFVAQRLPSLGDTEPASSTSIVDRHGVDAGNKITRQFMDNIRDIANKNAKRPYKMYPYTYTQLSPVFSTDEMSSVLNEIK